MKRIIVFAALAALVLATTNTQAQRANTQPVKADKLDAPWTLDEVKAVWQPGLQLNVATQQETREDKRRTVVESDDKGPWVLSETVAEGGSLKPGTKARETWPEDGLMDFGLKRELVKKPAKKKRNFTFGSQRCWVYSLKDSRGGMTSEIECWYLADTKYAGIMAYSRHKYTAPQKNVEIVTEVTGIRLASELPAHPADAEALGAARAEGARWTYSHSQNGKEQKQVRRTSKGVVGDDFTGTDAEREGKRAEWGEESEWSEKAAEHGFACLPANFELRDVDKFKTEKVKLDIGRIECVVMEYRSTDSRESLMGRLYYPTDPKYGGMPAKWTEWKMDTSTGKSTSETTIELIEFTPAD